MSDLYGAPDPLPTDHPLAEYNATEGEHAANLDAMAEYLVYNDADEIRSALLLVMTDEGTETIPAMHADADFEQCVWLSLAAHVAHVANAYDSSPIEIVAKAVRVLREQTEGDSGSEVMTDGGWPTGDPCPECGELMDVGAVGNPGETITWQQCDDCQLGWGPFTGFVPLEEDTAATTTTDIDRGDGVETDGGIVPDDVDAETFTKRLNARSTTPVDEQRCCPACGSRVILPRTGGMRAGTPPGAEFRSHKCGERFDRRDL